METTKHAELIGRNTSHCNAILEAIHDELESMAAIRHDDDSIARQELETAIQCRDFLLRAARAIGLGDDKLRFDLYV